MHVLSLSESGLCSHVPMHVMNSSTNKQDGQQTHKRVECDKNMNQRSSAAQRREHRLQFKKINMPNRSCEWLGSATLVCLRSLASCLKGV